MAKATLKINSVLGGISSSQYIYGDGQYNSAVGIDPDFPVASGIRTSGAVLPTVYEKFSGSNITGYPKFIANTTKNTNTYVYASDGKFVSYDSSLASETLVGTPTSGAGNGMAYYNNYVYLATPTDVSRYGPLDNSPSLTNTVWTGGTLGSQAALTDTTYPTVRGVALPNHMMHVHSDNSLYFCDYKNGQGLIHRINTRKVTAEGDTNGTTAPSSYNVLDLPFGLYPVAITSYDTDLAILALRTTDSTINQGPASLFFWDTVASSFYREVLLPDPLATALKFSNGILYIWSGNAVNGVRLSAYLGGQTIRQVAFLEEGTPPMAGAVDVIGNKVVFGSWTTYPASTASVFAYGSKNEALPKALHCIVRSTSAGANQSVTALRYSQQSSLVKPQLVVGSGDDSAKQIDKLSTTATYNGVFRSEVFSVGRPFSVSKVRIPLLQQVAANMAVTPKIYLDDDTSAGTALTAINSANYSGQRNIVYEGAELNALQASHNILLELNFTGTVQCPVGLPITIEIQYVDD